MPVTRLVGLVGGWICGWWRWRVDCFGGIVLAASVVLALEGASAAVASVLANRSGRGLREGAAAGGELCFR